MTRRPRPLEDDLAHEHEHDRAITYAEMDYSEHRKTYALFLSLVKYGTVITIAILIGLLAFFIIGWGWLTSILAFVVTLVVLRFAIG